MKAKKIVCKIVSGLLIVCYLCCCEQQKKVGEQKKICYVTENEDVISFDDLVKSRERIVLEQQKDSYLSDIQNVFLFDGEFYILDGKRGVVLVFDSVGNYARQVGRKGRGPGELAISSDFVLDRHNGLVKILDSQQSKLFTYSTRGNYVAEKGLSGKYAAFYKFDQDVFLYEREISSFVNYAFGDFTLHDPGDKYLMAYGGTDGKKKFFPINDQRMLDGALRYNRNCFSSFNKGVLFWQLFDNSIYYIAKDKLVEKYAVDFMSRNIPDDIMEQPFHTRLQLMMSPGNYEKYRGLINNVIGHKDLIIFSYQSPSGIIFIAWDIENDSSWRIVDESLDLENIALFKVSNHQFVGVGFSDFTSDLEPQIILTLFEMQ